MTKLKILLRFRDKYNSKLYEEDEIVEFSDERAKEILNNSIELAEIVETVKENKSSTEGSSDVDTQTKTQKKTQTKKKKTDNKE